MQVPISFGTEIWFAGNPMLQEKIFQEMAVWIASFHGNQVSLVQSFAYINLNFEAGNDYAYFPDLTDQPRKKIKHLPPNTHNLLQCRMN